MADLANPSTPVQTNDPSRNALKQGIFTNALLEGEDPQAVEVIVDDVINRFEVSDATGQIYARRLVQTTMQINRLNNAQSDYVDGYMQGETCRQEFCRQIGLPPIFSKELPDWFFADEEGPRKEAIQILDAVNEAGWLKRNHSVDRMTRAKSLVPNLWKLLMGEEGSAIQRVHTFGEYLAHTYKKSTAIENLSEFLSIMEGNYKYELLWARSAHRFDTIVKGIRATATMEAMSNPNWLRADSLYHRRSQDLVETLVSLKHEKSANHQSVIGVIKPIETVEKSARKPKRLKGAHVVVQEA